MTQAAEIVSNTPYDDVFRTLLTDCSRLMIPVINDVFGEQYAEDAAIISETNEHFLNRQGGRQEERITDSCFRIMEKPEKWYHVECQSTIDHTIIVRMFEYDAQIALTHHDLEQGVLTVNFPESAVMFLRHNRHTPDQMNIRILTNGGEVTYTIPVIKIQEYSLDEIFGKKLLFLIPFYIFRYEKQFPAMDQDETKQESLKRDYARIRQYLDDLSEVGSIDSYMKLTITEMTQKVLESIANRHPGLQEGVKKIMGGNVLDYEAKRIKQSGLEQGREEGREETWLTAIQNLIKRYSMSVEEAMAALGIPEEEKKGLRKALKR